MPEQTTQPGTAQPEKGPGPEGDFGPVRLVDQIAEIDRILALLPGFYRAEVEAGRITPELARFRQESLKAARVTLACLETCEVPFAALLVAFGLDVEEAATFAVNPEATEEADTSSTAEPDEKDSDDVSPAEVSPAEPPPGELQEARDAFKARAKWAELDGYGLAAMLAIASAGGDPVEFEDLSVSRLMRMCDHLDSKDVANELNADGFVQKEGGKIRQLAPEQKSDALAKATEAAAERFGGAVLARVKKGLENAARLPYQNGQAPAPALQRVK